jgi:hypothetical protein
MLQRHTRPLGERGTCWGKRYGALCALEERRADDFLERLNLTREGRLCDAQSESRLPKMEFLSEGGKVSKLAESRVGGLCHRS